jgi:tRNA-2-methylthio-N6-dimethylallyladenosine synthase
LRLRGAAGRRQRGAGIERIRFASPHPRHTGRRLIEAVRDLPKVCKHLAPAVQSGSSRVLKAMRRRYTRESYLDLVEEIRETVPDATLSTDMIVGFPGETDADFEQTLSLTRTAGSIHGMFSFKYSPRPNTLASKRMPDDVSEEEKTRASSRCSRCSGTSRRGCTSRRSANVEVLIDSASRRRDVGDLGRTSGNTVVNLRPAAETAKRSGRTDGQMDRRTTVRIRVRRAGPHSLWGETRSVSNVRRVAAAMLIEMTIKG